MESVDRTLLATQNLLQALEKDRTLLNDAFFMKKLAYLRMKHKETSNFLARLQRAPPTSHSCCNGVCQLKDLHPPTIDGTPRAKNAKKPIARDARDVLNLAARSKARRREELARARREKALLEKDDVDVRESVDHKRQRSDVPGKSERKGILVSGMKKLSRSNPSIEISDASMAKPQTFSDKHKIISDSKSDSMPRTTVPVPFKFSSRKPIVNTFSTKFVEEMVARKKQEEEEEESQAIKSKPFTAHAVPMSTYVSTNPRVMDEAYVEAIRRRVAGNLRKHFQQEMLVRKSKSMGNIAGCFPYPTLHQWRCYKLTYV